MGAFQTKPKPGRWQQDHKVGWDSEMGRFGHASVVIDQYLIIIGGMTPDDQALDANLIVFDMKKEICTQVEISGRKPSPLYHHSACYWKDNQIIVFGGRSGPTETETLSEVAIITVSFTEDSIKAEWRTVETKNKLYRAYHSAQIYKNEMIVVGNKGDDSTEVYKNEMKFLDRRRKDDTRPYSIHILDLDDFQWTARGQMPPAGGDIGLNSSVLIGHELYILGQVEKDRKFTFSCLSLEYYTWKTMHLSEEQKADFAAITEHDGKIYLASSSETVKIFATKGQVQGQEKWSDSIQLKDEKLSNDGFFSLNVYDNQLYLYGGRDTTRNGLFAFKQEDSEVPPPPKSTIQKASKGGITGQMKAFLAEAPYSDVIFEVESEKIPVHKWMLCKRSKYFANMFSSGMLEAKSSKIVISDMNATTFRAFLEYLYSDDIDLDLHLAQGLLTQADKYSVPELKTLCEKFLIGNISNENYMSLANLSELLEANTLRDAVRDYIAKNIKVLKPRKDFEEISMDMLRDVLIKVTVR